MSVRWAITYRPSQFREVVGQEHVVAFFQTVLTNYFEQETMLPVGVLFGGHSGVGKTTVARVIAASLNCDKREGVEPCGECETCREIIEGRGHVMEIDASFFGLVDNIRGLRDRLSSYSFSSYQVVILDECHMLSREASNVLLKLLEEPPKNVLFILCTTEVNKILNTVRSRLVEFKFTLIAEQDVLAFLTDVLKKETVTCSPELLVRLYKLSDFNVRDVLVALEQMALLGAKEITAETLTAIHGDVYVFEKLSVALMKGRYDEAMLIYQSYMERQSDFKAFVEGLSHHLGEQLRASLITGDPNSEWYAFALRTVYDFLSRRLTEYRGVAAARLLLFKLLPADVLGTVVQSIHDAPLAQVSGDELRKLLTEPT